MKRVDEITDVLKASNIKKSLEQIEVFKKSINNRLNPFSQADTEVLDNNNSGQSAPDKAEQFLLQVLNLVDRQRKEIIEECSTDPKRFESHIKKLF